MSPRLVVAAALAGAGVVGWLGAPAILPAVGRVLVAAEPPGRADAILVLGGDFFGPRVVKGAELGAQGFAPRVLISGPRYRDRPESELAIEFLVAGRHPRERFVSLPHHATNTFDEAVALAPVLRQLDVRRTILVTSATHSRRAALVFRLVCPDVRFVSVPADDDRLRLERWWRDPGQRRTVMDEWTKIAGTLFVRYPRHVLATLFATMWRLAA